jgi:hypothetical protein
MAQDIFVQFLHLRVSASVRTVLMSKPSRFFRNHIFCAVLSGTLLFLGCYLIPMLQLSDSPCHSLLTLKHNIEDITVRGITKGMKYNKVDLIKGMGWGTFDHGGSLINHAMPLLRLFYWVN